MQIGICYTPRNFPNGLHGNEASTTADAVNSSSPRQFYLDLISLRQRTFHIDAHDQERTTEAYRLELVAGEV